MPGKAPVSRQTTVLEGVEKVRGKDFVSRQAEAGTAPRGRKAKEGEERG